MDHSEIKDKIISGKYEVVELNISNDTGLNIKNWRFLNQLVVFPNNQIAAMSFQTIYIFDENFCQLNKFSEIDGEPSGYCSGIAINERNEIYFLNFAGKLITTNASFSKIINQKEFSKLRISELSSWDVFENHSFWKPLML